MQQYFWTSAHGCTCRSSHEGIAHATDLLYSSAIQCTAIQYSSALHMGCTLVPYSTSICAVQYISRWLCISASGLCYTQMKISSRGYRSCLYLHARMGHITWYIACGGGGLTKCSQSCSQSVHLCQYIYMQGGSHHMVHCSLVQQYLCTSAHGQYVSALQCCSL